MQHSWKRTFLAVFISAIGVAVTFCAGWAAREIAAPVEVVAADSTVYATVSEGEVASIITLGASVEWARTPMPANQSPGTLTTVPLEPQNASEGDELYTVDLRPVILGNGALPMYRDISAGMEGRDVAQLQGMLSRLGYYTGETDGVMDWWTKRAVQLWQKDHETEQDGIVRRGDILFLDTPSIRIVVDTDRQVGDQLAGGEAVIVRLADAPSVFFSLSEAQLAMVSPGMGVAVPDPAGGEWRGVIGKVTKEDSRGLARAELIAESGGPVCADRCDSALDQGGLLVSVFQVAPVTGLTVPVTALWTDEAGESYLERLDGTALSTRVLATAKGMAVVEAPGLKAGDQVAIAETP